jgi:hypothetical protein
MKMLQQVQLMPNIRQCTVSVPVSPENIRRASGSNEIRVVHAPDEQSAIRRYFPEIKRQHFSRERALG